MDDNTERGAHVGNALLDYEVPEDFIKFPVLDPDARILKDPEKVDRRHEPGDPTVDLPDYSGPFRADLRFTDFSKEALLKMIEMNIEYRRVWVGAWFEEAEGRFGRDERLELEWLAWRDGMVPKLEAMLREYLPPEYAEARLEAADLGRFVGHRPDVEHLGIDYDGPFASDPNMLELSKEQLVSIILGSHEYILQCNQGFSMQIVVRHGFGDMFAIAWDIWSAKVLPAVMDLKARNMGIDGNDVAAFMKDLQIDSSAMPGKAFDLTFEMPEKDVGVMTFNRCPAPAMFELLGREDILEQNCHAVCPASIAETAKLYNPNMKMDILAIPPRPDANHVCCRWKLSMRDESDPEYVQIEEPTTRKNEDWGRRTSGLEERALRSHQGRRDPADPRPGHRGGAGLSASTASVREPSTLALPVDGGYLAREVVRPESPGGNPWPTSSSPPTPT